MDMEAYSNAVKKVYEAAMSEFVNIKSARFQSVQDAKSAHIKSTVARSIIKIQELISAIQENLS